MSIRKKTRRIGALIAAVLLAVSGLVLPSSSQPAAAQDTCTPSEPNGYPAWTTEYNNRGVTLCAGDHGGGVFPPEVAVQIVDLTDGAKIRIISDAVDDSDPPDGDNLYNKRAASQWFNWIQSNTPTPSPSRLFSASNASFLVNTSGSTTPFSLPEMSLQKFSDHSTHTLTFGRAWSDHTDAAWDALKRAFVIGDASSGVQDVSISTFPTHYTVTNIFNDFYLQGTDGSVAFDPLYQIVDPVAPRTMAGTSDDGKVYILTALDSITLSEAQDILKSFGSQVEIQFDGGNSTQMYAEFGGLPYNMMASGRIVPDVLAVYLAP